MFAKGAGEVMGAVKLRFCAEVEVVALLVVQHRIDCCNARDTYRSRWQTRIAVGVERSVVAQVLKEYAGQREVADGILYGRARLQRHTFTQAVDIYARNLGISPLFLVSS